MNDQLDNRRHFTGFSTPEPSATECVAPANAVQHDIDPADAPEKPWRRAPGTKLTVHFENWNLSDRYWTMVQQAAQIWSRSPCVRAIAVEAAPPGSNRVAVRQKRLSLLQLDTDGEFRGQDRSRYRTGGTLTLYTRLLNTSSDNGALATVVHEMGHALGLVHRNDEHDVMHAETNDDTEVVPDAVDFRNLCVLYGEAPS